MESSSDRLSTRHNELFYVASVSLIAPYACSRRDLIHRSEGLTNRVNAQRDETAR
jgi:hypothetical protein